MRVVFAVEVEFGGRLQNQSVGQQDVVVALKSCSGLAAFADEGGGLGFEVVQRHALHAKRGPGLRVAGFEILANAGHHVPPRGDCVAPQGLDFGVFGFAVGAFGVQGMALYNFETEATAFIGEGGQTAARLEGDYDILLTNRLILQPTAELNFYGKNDPQRGIGSGLSNTEAGLRLRYEIRREIAPYIGVTWNRTYGKTADYANDEGEDRSEARLVLGVRLWF